MVTYTLGGGCFWCLDAVFRRLKGVESSICGYSGGTAVEADYYTVATGKTGHAETVQVTFDETVIPRKDILDLFFLLHNPTTRDRQGADVGPQYRSVMFYTDEAQKQQFEEAKKHAQANWDDPIVTEIKPLDAFYEAESEHQDYFTHNPANGYCSVIIAPKISKARQAYQKYFA